MKVCFCHLGLDHTERKVCLRTTVRGALATDGTSLFLEKPRWGGRDLGSLLSTRLAVVGTVEEDGAAALGRPREGEGVALGKPKDGDGKLGSVTADGKLLMCSLFMGPRETLEREVRYTYYIYIDGSSIPF